MYVYIWSHDGIPFYVGLTKEHGRTNPLNSGGRGWLCKQKLDTVGRQNVTVEVRITDSIESGQILERSLIEQLGRIQLNTGTLTNLRPGGDGTHGMSKQGRKSISERMTSDNPMNKSETREKLRKRMQDPDVKAKFSGDNNPAKRLEVREKLVAKWQDPQYRAAQQAKKLGRAIHSEEHKDELRNKLLDPANPMREYHKVLNSDPVIAAKRKAALQSDEVREKQRANANKRWSDPAKREALAEKMKAVWAARKAIRM
jgi:hypothetical protein